MKQSEVNMMGASEGGFRGAHSIVFLLADFKLHRTTSATSGPNAKRDSASSLFKN